MSHCGQSHCALGKAELSSSHAWTAWDLLRSAKVEKFEPASQKNVWQINKSVIKWLWYLQLFLSFYFLRVFLTNQIDPFVDWSVHQILSLSRRVLKHEVIHGTFVIGCPWSRKNWRTFAPPLWWKYFQWRVYLPVCQSFSLLVFSQTWNVAMLRARCLSLQAYFQFRQQSVLTCINNSGFFFC